MKASETILARLCASPEEMQALANEHDAAQAEARRLGVLLSLLRQARPAEARLALNGHAEATTPALPARHEAAPADGAPASPDGEAGAWRAAALAHIRTNGPQTTSALCAALGVKSRGSALSTTRLRNAIGRGPDALPFYDGLWRLPGYDPPASEVPEGNGDGPSPAASAGGTG